MKKTTIFILSLFNFVNIYSQEIFSDKEIKLLDSLNFDKEVIHTIKEEISADLTQYKSTDMGFKFENGKVKKTGGKDENGISFIISSDIIDELIMSKREILLSKGYLIFKSREYSNSTSILTVIKSNNQFDILKLEQPSATSKGLTYDVIEKELTELNEKYQIVILGSDANWVDILLKNPPIDSKKLTKKLTKIFDSTDAESIKKSITTSSILHLSL